MKLYVRVVPLLQRPLPTYVPVTIIKNIFIQFYSSAFNAFGNLLNLIYIYFNIFEGMMTETRPRNSETYLITISNTSSFSKTLQYRCRIFKQVYCRPVQLTSADFRASSQGQFSCLDRHSMPSTAVSVGGI